LSSLRSWSKSIGRKTTLHQPERIGIERRKKNEKIEGGIKKKNAVIERKKPKVVKFYERERARGRVL
jgi:hypothetical protein